jgi:hypothetical protein
MLERQVCAWVYSPPFGYVLTLQIAGKIFVFRAWPTSAVIGLIGEELPMADIKACRTIPLTRGRGGVNVKPHRD